MKIGRERLKLWTTRPSAQRLARPLRPLGLGIVRGAPGGLSFAAAPHAERYVAPGLVLLGDAARWSTLAGQGVNLGVRDVMALVPALRAGFARARWATPTSSRPMSGIGAEIMPLCCAASVL